MLDNLAVQYGVAQQPPPDRAGLPAATASFIGREHEIGALLRLFMPPGARHVTLTGPGGVGKTSLALVGAAVAHPLAIAEQPGQPLDGVLTATLRRRQRLLVLDVVEHLLGAAQQATGDLERAAAAYREMATLSVQIGDRQGMAKLLEGLPHVAQARGGRRSAAVRCDRGIARVDRGAAARSGSIGLRGGLGAGGATAPRGGAPAQWRDLASLTDKHHG